jgi:hypothetical protein
VDFNNNNKKGNFSGNPSGFGSLAQSRAEIYRTTQSNPQEHKNFITLMQSMHRKKACRVTS